jgi:hypothetical protein
MVRARYRFAPQTWLNIKFRRSDRQYYPATVKLMYVLRQVQYRFDFERIFADKFRIKTRLDYVFINDQGTKERGFNMFQDIRWEVLQTFTVYLRFGSFYTDSYNSRLYEYESDLPNVFSSYPLAGAGSKWYVYFIWKCIEEIEFQVKYRQQNMNDDRRRDLGMCFVFKW